ncbi:RluA family pseudouridine synthase [Hespellia stercorisuis]|uniref:RNA pseudouridylate synthase n=1 Tax=Hespellia stercorisuis DSM 15480 TaxID=1121950 RepID=A0A1M6S346_9FIRM|nr:RluA family pseudouridine synthase [Hespellia stercorisuis]SHK39155.1 23S rRNA pseudouridine955/2504/2580 synthase [Hespellia stercorisuis DSM 15480]
MREIEIASNEAGQRLDKMLAKYLKEAPKSFLYKMLRKKNIVLNGKKATGNEKLVVGDSVKLFLAEDTIAKFSGEELKIGKSTVKLDIIYEDADVVFINKPVGMLSQRAKDTDRSLNEHLLSYLKESSQITEQELKTFHPAVCNRLDRNTSGLIAAGKSLTGLQKLSEMFRERTLRKFYRCLVKGRVTETRKLEGYLVKDMRTNRVTVSEDAGEGNDPGDYIETEYCPVATGRDVSLLEVHLITGKTHQIRSHLASIGHPIVGDYKYGDREVNDSFKKQYGLQSQLLHSYRMEFPVMEEQLSQLSEQIFVAELPKLFSEIIKDRGVI